MYNLSSSVATSFSLLQLLSYPPKFIPTPEVCNHGRVFKDVIEFVRKLQWQVILPPSGAHQCRFGVQRSSLWPPIGRLPSHIRALSQRILAGARSILFSNHNCFSCRNLSDEEQLCLRSLSENSDVVVLPADKGGKWTLMNTSAYNRECLSQLGDEDFYRQLESPLIGSSVVFGNILNSLLACNKINRKEFNFLSPSLIPKDRTFYILPKIHKNVWPSPDMPPGRPIIADIDSSSGNTSRFVEFFLFPISKTLPSYLRDSQHLIAILRDCVLPRDFILCTFDVKALYTNIPINEGLQRVARAFNRLPNSERPDGLLLQLLKLSLERNDFVFADRFMQQTSGVAMGKAYSGSFANIYMGEWEDQALSSFEHRPTLWTRFQDDVFAVWPHGMDSLRLFHDHLNSVDPNIQLVMTHHCDFIHFLDLLIYRPSVGNHLSHRVAFKASACHRILPKSSHHAPHVFKSVIFSQVLRWATRSSTRNDFIETTRSVVPHWRAQGVTRSVLRNARQKVLTLCGFHFEWQQGFLPCSGPRCSVCSYARRLSYFKGVSRSELFPILFNISCATANCIYVIECKRCLVRYVGQTSNPLRQRIAQHVHDIRHHCPSSPLVPHFTDIHCLDDFSFFAIDRCLSMSNRLVKESKWIKCLKTCRPTGLNRSLSPYTRTVNLLTTHSDCTSRLNSFIRQSCREMSDVKVRLSYRTDRNLFSLLR